MREGRLNVRDIVGRPNVMFPYRGNKVVGEIRSDLVVNLFVVSPTSYTKIPRFQSQFYLHFQHSSNVYSKRQQGASHA